MTLGIDPLPVHSWHSPAWLLLARLRTFLYVGSETPKENSGLAGGDLQLPICPVEAPWPRTSLVATYLGEQIRWRGLSQRMASGIGFPSLQGLLPSPWSRIIPALGLPQCLAVGSRQSECGGVQPAWIRQWGSVGRGILWYHIFQKSAGSSSFQRSPSAP